MGIRAQRPPQGGFCISGPDRLPPAQVLTAGLREPSGSGHGFNLRHGQAANETQRLNRTPAAPTSTEPARSLSSTHQDSPWQQRQRGEQAAAP